MIEVFVRIAEMGGVQMAISFGCADIVDTPRKRVLQNILAFVCTLGMLMSGGGNWAENTRISFSSLAGTASSSPDFLRPKIRLRREFFLSNFLPPWMPPPTSGSVFTPLLPSLTNPSSPDKTLLKLSSPFLPLILSELFLSSSKILLA